MPPEVLNSEAILRSGVLANTQVILTKDNHVHSVYPSAKCLHVRKPDDLPADGAVWNFPNVHLACTC